MKKAIKRTVLILVTSMLLSSVNVFAAITPSSNELSVDEVIRNVEYQIDTYVEFDIQGKGRGIYAGSDVVPLYDLKESIIAYIIPLFDSSNNETGYMISSAYADGSIMCELSLDNIVASDFRNTIAENDKLIYLSLMNFGFKADGSANNELLYGFDKGDIIKLVNAKKNMRDIWNKSLKNSENLMNIDLEKATDFSDRVKKSESRLAASAKGTIDHSVVDDHFEALIEDPLTKYYGGSQMWWTDGRENYGCGSVAGANIMAYYDKWHSLSGLYTPFSRSKNSYITHMNNVEVYLKSGLGQLMILGQFASGVEKYSAAYGHPVKAHWNNDHEKYPTTLAGYSRYMIDGLSNGHPVAYLQWWGSNPDYDLHWMTATKYFQNDVGRWIAVSTWAKRESLDFALVVDTLDIGSGLLYFTYTA